MAIRILHRAVFPALVLLLGCPGDDTGGGAVADGSTGAATGAAQDSTGEPAAFDEDEVIARAGMYATELVQINEVPFASQHGLADTVNVFIDQEAAELYRSLDPEAPADVAFPEGTLVVKEHLDAAGAFDGYLLMYRGPDDYEPEGGNWFWARVDGSLTTQETGAVGFCIGCHQPSPSFLFGVPADNQL